MALLPRYRDGEVFLFRRIISLRENGQLVISCPFVMRPSKLLFRRLLRASACLLRLSFVSGFASSLVFPPLEATSKVYLILGKLSRLLVAGIFFVIIHAIIHFYAIILA